MEFEASHQAVTACGIEIEALVPGDLGRLDKPSEAVLHMAQIAARLLRKSGHVYFLPVLEGRQIVFERGVGLYGERTIGRVIDIGGNALAIAGDRLVEQLLV